MTSSVRRFLLATAVVAALLGARERAVRSLKPQILGPTFNSEVVRIFQAQCQSCHHPGDIAPFSLMTYGDAFPNAALIKLKTQTHQMPPWKPVGGCGDFADPRLLTQEQIDTLGKWVDNGAPEGNASDLPASLQFDGGWALGQPDLVLSNAEAYTPPTSGDMYRCFTMPTNLSSDAYVAAVDVRPGDRNTVHHVIAFIDTTGASASLESADPQPGYQCFGGPGFSITSLDSSTLGGWAPGARPVRLPEGVSYLLPANSRVVLQVHYHPHSGSPKPDQTQIGIYYSKTKPTKLLRVLPLINQTFTIPPNDSNYRVLAPADGKGFTIPFVNTHVWLIAPHMHLLGRKMHVTATLPNGQTQCLINIDDWDFNWQGMYRYKDPVAVPMNTNVSLEAFYDNSTSNLRNPNDPPKPVSWGEQTTDEMCIAFLGFTVDSENYAKGQVADVSWLPKMPQ